MQAVGSAHKHPWLDSAFVMIIPTTANKNDEKKVKSSVQRYDVNAH